MRARFSAYVKHEVDRQGPGGGFRYFVLSGPATYSTWDLRTMRSSQHTHPLLSERLG